jgi:kynurenine formamidase
MEVRMSAAAESPITPAWIEQVFQQTKNWGRWGADDQRGALNLMTPETRRAAAALVRDGATVSCARDLAVEPSAENPRPAQHHMLVAGDVAAESSARTGMGGTGDYVGVAFHGFATSHIDALCHIVVEGRLFNGWDASEVRSTGAAKDSIEVARDGIVGRGVLLDVPRLRGVPWLEPGEAIGPDELSRAEAAAGLRVGTGDVLLVSTGRDARRVKHGPWDAQTGGLAGLSPRCIPWLDERGVAVLGCDGVSDPLPASSIEGWPLPIHQCCLVGMGVHLLDNLALAELASACAERNRWEFFFVVAPLRIPGGTGSPVNPIAIF